ncbi:MAG TPA: MTAP family purine nucleoside phosphorylase [Fimbriimonadaceae bacterium]|nr:MTAP family purine nucleoside phosphorylase [Fimbriimonadaceae bacterium]
MRADVAIIGGTGVGSRLNELGGTPIHIPTPYGMARGRLVSHVGVRLILLQRHGIGHKTPPHGINYQAIADAVRRLKVKACFSTAATGGLRADWPNGTMAVCHEFIDATARNLTMFERDVVHTDFSEPFAESARHYLLRAAEAAGVSVKDRAIYVNGNGPRYETPHEIELYRRIGGDVVGMTAATEAILMGESGVPYACLAVVTNPGCGMAGQPLSHEEVVEQMEKSGADAVQVLLEAAKLAASAA